MIRKNSILGKMLLGMVVMLLLTGCAKDAPSFQDTLADAPASTETESSMKVSDDRVAIDDSREGYEEASNAELSEEVSNKETPSKDLSEEAEIVESDPEDSIEDDAKSFYDELADAGATVVNGNEMAELGIRAMVGEFDPQIFPEGSSELWVYLYHCIQHDGTEELEIGHGYGYGKDLDETTKVIPVVLSMVISDSDEEDWRFYQKLSEFSGVGEDVFIEMALIDGVSEVVEDGLPAGYSVREFEVAWVMEDENGQPKAYSVSHTVALDNEDKLDVVCAGVSSGMFVLDRYLERTGAIGVMLLNSLARSLGPDEAEMIRLYDDSFAYDDFSFEKIIEITKQSS